MSKNKENSVKQYVEMSINYRLYFLMDCLNMFRAFSSKNCFSDEVNRSFDDLVSQVNTEVGELDCYALEGAKVVEYGYKYADEN